MPTITSGQRRLRRLGCLLASAGLLISGALWAQPALAAGESVSVTLTTTSDPGGRNVVVHIDNNGSNDVLSVWSAGNTHNDGYEGTVALGGDYVSTNTT